MIASGTGVSSQQRAILIVDDDLGTCETFAMALRADGYSVRSAHTAGAALELSRTWTAQLLLVDLHLPDMLGIDLVRAMRHVQSVPFVLMSAFLTTDATVAAMRLGASNVVEKPIEIDMLRELAASLCNEDVASGRDDVRPRTDQIPSEPASIADQWAGYVLRACQSAVDLPTVGRWARFVGASPTTVGESCRILDIKPRDSRDLMRVLRALMQSSIHHCRPEAMLLIGDGRTLNRLLDRAGFKLGHDSRAVTIDWFLDHQAFVARENEGLAALRRRLNDHAQTSAS